MIKNFKGLNFFLPHTWLLYTLYAGITFYSRFELIPYCFDAFSFHIYTLIHLFVLALSVIAPTPIFFGKKKKIVDNGIYEEVRHWNVHTVATSNDVLLWRGGNFDQRSALNSMLSLKNEKALGGQGISEIDLNPSWIKINYI